MDSLEVSTSTSTSNVEADFLEDNLPSMDVTVDDNPEMPEAEIEERGVESVESVCIYSCITLFGASFPLVSLIFLAVNCIYLRSYALDILTAYKRPPYQCASDIGTIR